MSTLNSIKKHLENERFSLSKYLALVPTASIVVSFLGWCIHLAGCYKTTGVPKYSNEFLGVWLAAYTILIACLSLYILLSKGSLWPISKNKTVWTHIIFVVASDILDLYADEVLAVWCLLWMANSTVVIVFIAVQLKKDKQNPSEEEKDTSTNRGIRCLKCFGRGCGWCSFILAFFFMFLLAYQAIALGSDHGRFPPLGELIEVEGENGGTFKLHLYCTGPEGAPVTFLLEAGGGACSTSFAVIQTELTNTYNKRVCSYDRAGYGWSQMGELPRTSTNTMKELRQLLTKAGEAGPFVLVGHSVGGQLVQIFAGLYTSDVVGMVVVDSYPDYLNLTAPAYNRSQSLVKSMIKSTLSTVDLFRGIGITTGLSRWFVGGSPDFALKSEEARNKASYGTYSNWNAQYWDYRAFSEDPTDKTQGITIGNKPVVVVPAGDTVNKPCSAMKYAENSKQCIELQKVNQIYYQSAVDQAARLSTNSSVSVCPYPCNHGMIWNDNYRFVLERILALGF